MYDNERLTFIHIDMDTLFKKTPLYDLYQQKKFDTHTKIHSQVKGLTKDFIKSVHYSDAIRLVLIEKYGGFYSDLDMIIIRPLDGFQNVLSCDEGPNVHKGINVQNLNSDFLGTKVSNAIFHFDKGNVFIKKCLELYESSFDGRWGSGGPNLFQKVLTHVCNLDYSSQYLSSDKVSPERCQGIRVLKYKYEIFMLQSTSAHLLFSSFNMYVTSKWKKH